MAIFEILLTSVLSVIVLFLITRLIGYRQIAELSLFDYINGITIGSIGAELALAPLGEFYKPLIATGVYGLLTLMLALITDKSLPWRRKTVGPPLLLFSKGSFDGQNMKKARIDLSEFLMQCRELGYFDLSEIHTALIEPNGALSVLPYTAYRPVTPDDLHITGKEDGLFANVIMDGEVLEKNLRAIGFDRAYLEKELARGSYPSPKEIFLATLDKSGKLSVFLERTAPSRDILS